MVAATIEAFGRLDVLYNNAAIQMSGRLVDMHGATSGTSRSRPTSPRSSGRAGPRSRTCVDAAVGFDHQHRVGARADRLARATRHTAPRRRGSSRSTRQIATEYGPKVRANVIAPGSIDTPRFRKVAEEMPDPESFLAGPAVDAIPLHRLGTRRRHRRASRCSSRATSRRTRRARSSRATAAWRRTGEHTIHRRALAVVTGGGVGARRGDRDPARTRRRTASSSPTSTRRRADASPTSIAADGGAIEADDRRRAQRGRGRGDGRRRRRTPRSRSTCSCAARRSRRARRRRLLRRRLAARARRQPQGPVPLHEARDPGDGPQRRRLGRADGFGARAASASPGYAAYCASKGALVNLAKQAAIEHAPDGVRVNVVVAVGDRHRAVHARWSRRRPIPTRSSAWSRAATR